MRVQPTHRTQPHRRARGRRQSPVLSAMKRGRPAFMPHPMNTKRRLKRKRPRRLSQILRPRY